MFSVRLVVLGTLLTAFSGGALCGQAGNDLSQSDQDIAVQDDGELAQLEHIVYKFANEHHRELRQLLNNLKRKDEPKYVQALQQINLQIDRIERYREIDAERHELELKLWVARSKKSVMAAKLIVQEDAAADLQQQLNGLEEAAVERAALEKRLNNLRRNLTRLSNRLEQLVGEELKLYKSKIELDRTRILQRAVELDKYIQGFDPADADQIKRLANRELNRLRPSLSTPRDNTPRDNTPRDNTPRDNTPRDNKRDSDKEQGKDKLEPAKPGAGNSVEADKPAETAPR